MQRVRSSAWALAELLNSAVIYDDQYEDVFITDDLNEDTSLDSLRVSHLLNALSSHVVAFNHRVRDNCLSEVESATLLAKTSDACDAIMRQQQQYATAEQK